MNAERLLAAMTIGLHASRAEWGRAMRAETAAIEDPAARRDFALDAARAAFRQGFGARLLWALAAGAALAAVALVGSRVQLDQGGPGVLGATMPFGALALLLLALAATLWTRSPQFGAETGLLGVIVGLGAMWAVVAAEGLLWMDRLGVFILDADAPNGPVTDEIVILDLIRTGLWLPHLVFWMIGVVLGVLLARGILAITRLSPRRSPRRSRR
jgi:hypothetical protein